MFDTHVTKHQTTVTPITQVVEKTISPDKVTEMYDKVDQELQKQISRRIVVRDNQVSGSIVLYDMHHPMIKKCVIRVIVNGKESISEKIFEPMAILSDNDLCEAFYEAVREAVERNLVMTMLPGFLQEWKI